MQFTTVALAAIAASVVSAQGVTAVLTPTSPAPAGCATNYNGNFEITVVLPSKKRDVAIERRAACGGSGVLVAALKGGVLTDALGRIGAIVANRQFQFDGPPAQTGSIYTGGWSVCGNGSLALGGSTVFYQCLSGTFYNLYDRSTGAQCNPVEIDVIPCTVGGATPPPATTSRVSQIGDGQVQASSAASRVSQISDGQIQASSAAPRVTQIGDGQIQATSAVARPPVSQFSDGQLQVTAARTSTASRAAVTQISDGQIQASAATSRVSTVTRAPVGQISDGQIQATTAANRTQAAATSTRAVFTAGAPLATMGVQLLGAAAAVAGLALL